MFRDEKAQATMNAPKYENLTSILYQKLSEQDNTIDFAASALAAIKQDLQAEQAFLFISLDSHWQCHTTTKPGGKWFQISESDILTQNSPASTIYSDRSPRILTAEQIPTPYLSAAKIDTVSAPQMLFLPTMIDRFQTFLFHFIGDFQEFEKNSKSLVAYAHILNQMLQRAWNNELAAMQVSALTHVASSIIITTGSDTRELVLYVNPSFYALTGISYEEVQDLYLSFPDLCITTPPATKTQSLHKEHQWQEIALKHKDGHHIWVESKKIQIHKDVTLPIHFNLYILYDISARKKIEKALEFRAQYDELTGLANRPLLLDRLEQALHIARRYQRHTALILMNMDRFGLINELYGREAGDQVLCEVAIRLQWLAREGDTVARLGADEFALLLPDMADPDEIGAIVERIQNTIKEEIALDENLVVVSMRMGVSVFPRDTDNMESLTRNAEAALHQAKEMGTGNVQFFSKDFNEKTRQRLSLLERLRRALERQEFELAYQPIAALSTGEVLALEALLRWNTPDQGIIMPLEFLSLAEEFRLIPAIGAWVLDEACRQNAQWQRQGLKRLPVSINLSPVQISEQPLLTQIKQTLETHRLEPEYLELELTEQAFTKAGEKTLELVKQVKSLGGQIALDKFGVGSSTLEFIAKAPFDHLKIDAGFTSTMTHNPHNAVIVSTIIAMAKELGLKVIAVGAQEEAQINFLRSKGCDGAQGFYCSAAKNAEQTIPFLDHGMRFRLPSEKSGDHRRTLLILDDEVNITRALRRLFRQENYNILVSNNPHEAFALLSEHNVNVVISDQRMPEMNGTEFLSKVKATYPNTVRILLTGYTDIASVKEAVNKGWVYKFLTKPWEDDELRRDVHEAFEHYEKVIKQQ